MNVTLNDIGWKECAVFFVLVGLAFNAPVAVNIAGKFTGDLASGAVFQAKGFTGQLTSSADFEAKVTGLGYTIIPIQTIDSKSTVVYMTGDNCVTVLAHMNDTRYNVFKTDPNNYIFFPENAGIYCRVS